MLRPRGRPLGLALLTLLFWVAGCGAPTTARSGSAGKADGVALPPMVLSAQQSDAFPVDLCVTRGRCQLLIKVRATARGSQPEAPTAQQGRPAAAPYLANVGILSIYQQPIDDDTATLQDVTPPEFDDLTPVGDDRMVFLDQWVEATVPNATRTRVWIKIQKTFTPPSLDAVSFNFLADLQTPNRQRQQIPYRVVGADPEGWSAACATVEADLPALIGDAASIDRFDCGQMSRNERVYTSVATARISVWGLRDDEIIAAEQHVGRDYKWFTKTSLREPGTWQDYWDSCKAKLAELRATTGSAFLAGSCSHLYLGGATPKKPGEREWHGHVWLRQREAAR